MADPLTPLTPWLYEANTWFLTAVAVAGLLAFLRHQPLARRFLPSRDATAGPGRFERFWSRRDGRAIAIVWIALVMLTIGDGGLIWSDQWKPVKDAFAVLQPVSGVLLVPMTAALYLYKRAVPQIARDESDERERDVQGAVYRRAHSILIGALAVLAGLLLFNPAIGEAIAGSLESRGVVAIDVALPAFLMLFMLPSVAYAWMQPHREDEPPEPERGHGRPVSAEAA
jgi:hypothetical protein